MEFVEVCCFYFKMYREMYEMYDEEKSKQLTHVLPMFYKHKLSKYIHNQVLQNLIINIFARQSLWSWISYFWKEERPISKEAFCFCHCISHVTHVNLTITKMWFTWLHFIWFFIRKTASQIIPLFFSFSNVNVKVYAPQ